jgi:predicted glutamine amidotransferase
MAEAAEATLREIRAVRKKLGIAISSSANLFITDGKKILGVRFCFDFGCYPTHRPEAVHEANFRYLSMWYTTGREFGLHEGEWKMIGGEETADSIVVASEPLTRDTSTWSEVPEHSMVLAATQGDRPVIECRNLAV